MTNSKKVNSENNLSDWWRSDLAKMVGDASFELATPTV